MALGVATSLWLLRGQQAPAAGVAVPAMCIRLSFGWRDTVPRRWDGRVEVKGGRLERIEGWRFGPNDSVQPEGSWRAASGPSVATANPVWPGAACALEDDSLQYNNRHPLPAVGVLLFLDTPGADIEVTTPAGPFSVNLGEMRSGRVLPLLDGHARAELVPASTAVDPASPEQDHPSLTAGGDGSLWMAYQSYNVSRHEDRILLKRHQDGRWGEALDVAGPGNYYQPQAAVDGRGRVWVVWAELVGPGDAEDWELFARAYSGNRWSDKIRVTQSPGGDFNHRLAASPEGVLHLVWQGNRSGNWDIFLSRLNDTRWSPPQAITNTPESDWAPAIATGRNGKLAVAYDSLRRGSYNIYLRLFEGGQWQPEFEAASGEGREANASVAIDAEDRVWIAWDDGGPSWGFDSACNGLYRQRHMDLRAWTDGGWQTPLVKPMRDLPPAMTRFVSLPHIAADAEGRLWLFFRHWSQRQVYEYFAMAMEKGGWSDPVPIPLSTGREYQRISTALAGGKLWAGWSSDGSQARAPKPKHYSVFAAPLPSAPAAPAEIALQRGTPPLNITVAMPPEPARYTATHAGRKLSVWWGDLHRHTDISGHRFTDGSIEDTYRYASDVAKLDFIAPTDHVAIGTPTVENIQGDDYHWWRIQKAVDLFGRAGVFTPIYAYERSMQSPGGHRNMLYLKRGAVPIPGNIKDPVSNDPASLWEKLQGQRVLVTPHTPGDVMQPLIKFKPKPDFEPLLEIYQGLRSSYEYVGAPPEKRLGGTQTSNAGHFLQDALAMGLRYGVQASSDHLATHINFTGVYAENPSREALFAAMNARRTFAASDKIVIDFRMGGHWMGEEFRAVPTPPAEVMVMGTARLRSVEVIRNGEVAHAVEPEGTRVEFTWRDARLPRDGTYYYIRVIQEDGNMAWSSPIWIVR